VPYLLRQTKPNKFSGSALLGIVLPKHIHAYFQGGIYGVEYMKR
jgi:hypothetical protein